MFDWKGEINQVYAKHCNKIEKCPSDTILYHYTSPAGFLGILHSSSFWFSDSDFLNDASESYYFKDVFSNANTYSSGTRKEKIFKFNTEMFSYYHTSNFSEHRQTSNNIKETRYILSLSLDNDNLNLWNYYTKNANGIGYCIGIKEDSFENIVRPDETIFSGKVIYDHDIQLRLLSELVDDYWVLYTKLTNTYQRKYLYEKLEDNVVRYSIFMKNPLFAGENEYRIAIVRHGSNADKERLFRENNGAFIPYVTQPISVHDVCAIGISPTHRSDYVIRSIGELLDSLAIDASISKSKIPLRF